MVTVLRFTQLIGLSLAVCCGPALCGEAAEQADFWTIEQLPTPPDAELEVGALEWIPGINGRSDRLAVASRRGEIWMATGTEGETAGIRWQRFAAGLHEVLGLAWRPADGVGPDAGWLYATQRGEVSRLADDDGDGRADRFETVSDGWGINGDYHEYAFGSKFDAAGDIWVVLCLTGSSSSKSLFRGWCLRVNENGTTVPTCSGIRSPGGVGFGCDGEVYYTDNQGLWNGTCSLKHLVPGDFMGHPGGNRWYEQAPGMGEPPVEPKSGSRIATEMQRIEQLRPPAVQFPYDLMGKSAAGVVCDTTEGGFGPFAGQLLVTDQSHSIVMRCCIEEVEGIRQGACFRMLEGFRSGSLAEQFSPAGTLYVGGTNRPADRGALRLSGFAGLGRPPLKFVPCGFCPLALKLSSPSRPTRSRRLILPGMTPVALPTSISQVMAARWSMRSLARSKRSNFRPTAGGRG